MIRARLFRLVREVLLTSTAVLGAACLVLTVLALGFNIRPLMFRSGSMSPTIDTGDLSLSRTVGAADLHRGDIVSVLAANGQRVTHRVVSITGSGDTRELTLKGDANDVVDNQVYDVKNAQRVLFTIPKAGYVVNWFSHAPGAYVLALYLGLMLMLIFRRPQDGHEDPAVGTPVPEVLTTAADEPQVDAPQPGRRRPLRAVVVGSGLIVGFVALSAWTLPTGAYWTDTSAVTGTSFTTSAAFKGPTLTCTTGNSIVTMNWTAWPGATGYVLHFGAGGGSTATVSSSTLSRVFNVVGQSGTFTVEATTSGANSPLSNAKVYSVGNGVGNTTCT